MSDTIVTTGVVVPGTSTDAEPRPGSRAARLRQPIAKDVARELAVQYGVCVRPVWLRRTDLATGQTEVVSVPLRGDPGGQVRTVRGSEPAAADAADPGGLAPH